MIFVYLSVCQFIHFNPFPTAVPRLFLIGDGGDGVFIPPPPNYETTDNQDGDNQDGGLISTKTFVQAYVSANSTAELFSSSVTEEDSGIYQCVGETQFNSSEITAAINVLGMYNDMCMHASIGRFYLMKITYLTIIKLFIMRALHNLKCFVSIGINQ